MGSFATSDWVRYERAFLEEIELTFEGYTDDDENGRHYVSYCCNWCRAEYSMDMQQLSMRERRAFMRQHMWDNHFSSLPLQSFLSPDLFLTRSERYFVCHGTKGSQLLTWRELLLEVQDFQNLRPPGKLQLPFIKMERPQEIFCPFCGTKTLSDTTMASHIFHSHFDVRLSR
jgi:hypothetical protein